MAKLKKKELDIYFPGKEEVFKIILIIHDKPPAGEDYLVKASLFQFIKNTIEEEYTGVTVE